MGLDLGWNKGPRDFSKFASCNLKGTWGGGGGGNFHYKGIYRCAAGMGYTFQASQYMNGYHFHIKSISMGYLFHPKSI